MQDTLVDNPKQTHRKQWYQSTLLVTLFIAVLGCAISGGFMALGISAAYDDQQHFFERSANDLITKIEDAWGDYVNMASVIHGRCRSRDFTRTDFRDLYEYLVGQGLDFQAAQFDPNITREKRAGTEEEARAFYKENYPHVKYRGIIGFNYDNSTFLEPRHEADYYFPVHYLEPVDGNEAAIELDYSASGSRRRTVLYCMENGKPALTDRLRLVQEKTAVAYGVVLMHPGFELSTGKDIWPRDLASVVIRIPDLIRRSASNQRESSAVVIEDKSDSRGVPLFLGAARITASVGEEEAVIEYLDQGQLSRLERSSRFSLETDIPVANKIWTIRVDAVGDTFEPDYLFVIIGGVVILVASGFLACWIKQNTNRIDRIHRLEAEAASEKAALIVEGARQSAQAERDLNDFIAHEVRNPVAAAMSACSFVKTSLNKESAIQDEETIINTKSDVRVIDNSLNFVNDLLRNMLDMHRASAKKLKVDVEPTDILHDVFEPVQAMLMQRDGPVEVLVDCPEDTFAMGDRLRLNQIAMNLGRNSIKFVEEGFVKLRAQVRDGRVEISVEDSGPGIPEDKKGLLFQKYQQSLDMLSQGTGIGLSLCKNLTELMDGEIYLDGNYDSGIPGFPGSRFVVSLKLPPADFQVPSVHLNRDDSSFAGGDAVEGLLDGLPAAFSVLFVDDDPVLRKLFARSVKLVAPSWSMREASSGETALRLVETEQFDLIFMDFYMASTVKQLLGTEAIMMLRSRGVTSLICGLSANDKEVEFLAAGANAFTFKPFPCEKSALRRELQRILASPPLAADDYV